MKDRASTTVSTWLDMKDGAATATNRLDRGLTGQDKAPTGSTLLDMGLTRQDRASTALLPLCWV